MKICQLCAVDFTLYHFLRPLIHGMAAEGHDVVAVCAEGAYLDAVRADGIRVETVPFERSFNLRSHWHAYRRLKRLFRQEKFDLVHVHTPVAALIGRIAAWRTGVPRIAYTAHGFYFHDGMAPLKRRLFIGLEWLAGRLTDVLFTQSAEDAETARRYHLCRGGVIEAIGNGSDPARFTPADEATRAALRRDLDAGPDDTVILMVGRLVAEKGYPELFAAMRHVDAVLWVAGDRLPSDHADAIDDWIARIGRDETLAKRIKLLGYRSDMPALMAAADIFTLPSHREGMPRSIAEAMLCGLPVVATDIRGSREEVVDGETGLLVPVNDSAALAGALSALVTDKDKRQRFGAASLQRARDLFDETKIVARQIAVLGLRRDD